jgi:hypothetical protein
MENYLSLLSLGKWFAFFKRKIKDFIYYFEYFLLKLTGESDEIITIIDGGLGSQMGQYAMGQEIQRITGIQVSYDLSFYEVSGKDILNKENRLYELETVFPNITVNKASEEKIKIYKRFFNLGRNDILIQNLDDIITHPVYLGGYYSSEKYTNYSIENLHKMFTFGLSLDEKNKLMLDKILSCECSVAIQIRLGDYVGSVLDVTTPSYFHNAVDYLSKKIISDKINFFVFSTDIERCMNILTSSPFTFTYVNINDNDHGAYDMYLMSNCHHFIISNSTFGFWPALLSDRCKEKIVIQPDRWLKTDLEKLKPKYSGWITMGNRNGEK